MRDEQKVEYMEWMDSTQTVMTTRAPGVLISNVCPLGIFSMNEKELIKTSGIWQGGNDWRSPLP